MATDRNQPTVPDRPAGAHASRPAGPPASAFDPPRASEARYAERAELGRGGMGRVAEAVDVALGRRVAVKHVLTDDPVAVARFEREARITARLEHPSIVPLYDVGRTPDGTPFYVMRKVDGRPLEQLVEEGVASEALIPNVLAACDAVAYAHARGIIHRDIKPPNILVGAYGETLMIDWGLARTIDEAEDDPGTSHTALASSEAELTRAGTVAGTPGFMAPEQARGEATDARTDVFALGSTLFYVLARRPPYASATSGTEMIGRVAAERPPEWDAIPPETRRDLRAIVMKAMATRPADRYADAGELAADLRRFVTGNLVGAHAYGRLERLRRFVARHRAAVTIASGSLVVLAIVAVIAVRRVIVERDAARTARALAEQRREEALDQADDQLVRRAHAELERDPLAAIGQLRSLRPGSRKWRDAALVLEGARVRGIPFGFTLPATTSRPEISGLSPRAVVVLRDGQLALIDLARRSLRLLPGSDGGARAAWYEDAIVLQVGRALSFRDGTTGVELRTLPMPGEVTWLDGDNVDDLWCIADGTAYRLVDHGARWERMLDDVTRLTPSTTFDRIIVEHATAYGVWVGSREITVGPIDQLYNGNVAIHGDRLLVQTGLTTLTLSRIVPTEGVVRVTRTIQLENVSSLGTIGDNLVAHASLSLYTIDDAWSRMRSDHTYAMLSRTDRGGTAVRVDGTIDMEDARGRFSISPTKLRYRQICWSTDGRFVIANVADSNLLVAWDLSGFRSAFTLDEGDRMLGLTPHSVWTSNLDEVRRRDLADFTRGERYPNIPMISEMSYDDAERFVVLQSPLTGVVVIDREVNERFALPDIAAWNVTPTGLVYATRDRVVHVIDAASPKGRVLATVPDQPVHLIYDMESARLVTVVEGAIGILDLATKRYAKLALAAAPKYIAIGTDKIWMIVDGALIVLVDGRLVPVAGVRDCDRLGVTPDRTLAHCTRALFSTLVGNSRTEMTPLAEEVRAWSVGNNVVAFSRARGAVYVLHRSSELAIALPLEIDNEHHLQAIGDRIAYEIEGQKKSIVSYDLQPATSEAELRARLAAITNAVTYDNATAMTWPDR